MTLHDRFLVAAVIATTLAPAPARGGGEVVSVEVRSLSEEALEDVPVTFGQVFRKGDVPKGRAVILPGGQVDVKRRYDDGSVRFAVVTAVIPELRPGKGTTLALRAGRPEPRPSRPPVSLSDLLRTDFGASVTLTFPDGAVRSASARKLLERAGGSRTWLAGPRATEWIVSGPPTDKEGKPDEDLNVQFHVRASAGCKAVRVSVVVENCWDTWAGNIRYDAKVTVGGREVFSAEAVDHRPLSRWRKVFWWPRGEPPVHVVHETAYMSAAGAIPNYDTTLRLPAPRGKPAPLTGPTWQILGSGSLTRYMPTTGGRPEIGPYPAWTVRYLLGMHPRAKKLVLLNGDLAGSWPIHVRARTTGRVMSIDDRAKFWLDARGSDKPAWKPDRTPPAGKERRLVPDRAHQPSLAYVPYLVTGDYYYLEEAYLWAGYCLISTWDLPRQGAKGIISGQIRGTAWALRNIADAATMAPDGDPEGTYFAGKVRNTLAYWRQRMLGPPEHNTLGWWGARTTQDARIQDPANPNWIVIAPWEHDYLMWSLHHAVELGFAEAGPVRDFLLRWRVGALTSAPDFDPQQAAPYRMVVGQRDPKTKKTTFYEDWKTLGVENRRLYPKAGLPNYAGSYAYSARGAVVCAVDAGFPKARQALKIVEGLLADHRQRLAAYPTWAIVPGGAAVSR